MNDLQKFAETGLSFREPEIEQVDMPKDITMLSSEQLAEKFSALTAWADYIASQLSMAIIEERAALRARDLAENRLLVRKMGTAVRGERITLVKAQVAIDDEIVQLSDEYEIKYAVRKRIEVYLSNHERDLSLVSREITRRANDQRAFRKDYGV